MEDCQTELTRRMILYYSGDPKRIQHFLKVHAFAALIGRLEGVDGETLETLETAALVHDIGIRVSEEKFGRCDGKLQEREGPPVAEALLTELGYSPERIARVSWLIAHHHTYDQISGPDYQILVEADFLVNAYEDSLPPSAIRRMGEKVFSTKTGKRLLEQIYR